MPNADAAGRAKAEKIRLALEKMREASVQKLFIKAFTLDGSGKSLLVDEGMSVAHVCRLLADKNHVAMDPKWAVVEHLPDLFMGKYLHLNLEFIFEFGEYKIEWMEKTRVWVFYLQKSSTESIILSLSFY